ncbi:carbamoyl-phosphate synthase L chain, ATP binding domain-containing protein [Bipolaris maydis]|nr:carbamoyl-phosphate synthase L chain, ATP binding domain-containing protein [Bipolaris maydis]
MDRPPQRPIKRLLIANRGEIATRIISTARELDIETYAIYTSGDETHAVRAAHAIRLESAATFMSTDKLIEAIKHHQIDAVHPGYGFLSESEEFCKRVWDEAGAVVVGPGWGILSNTGDKLKARQLAEACNVPISPALEKPTNKVEDVQKFASRVGYPIMVKAVDGGGGRGIRLIRNEEELASSVKRAVEESPSKSVFAEKAAVDGFRHVEVQIIGDGTGNVTHLWERECSIQRRYQKVVEFAPSLVPNRPLIAKIIEDALKMARHISYFSLGTFEFLVHPTTQLYYFLEVNPRLQVEHTITEALSTTDIVKSQLLLSQGATLSTCGLPLTTRSPSTPPTAHSIQLRITAENTQSNWSLSIGKISSFNFPLETARRALDETYIAGVKTNIDMLKAIMAHPDFLAGQCDTQWLEGRQEELTQQSQAFAAKEQANGLDVGTAAAGAATGASHLEITRVLRNDFPASLTADVLPYTITLAATSASAAAATAQHRRGNVADASHVVIPFPGKLVEVLVDEGDVVKEGDVICVVQQMKMELEVRTHRRGRVSWVLEVEDGRMWARGRWRPLLRLRKMHGCNVWP